MSGGHGPAVRALLKAGVNAALKDLDGDTALHMAARHGDQDVVTLLIDHGVPVAAVSFSISQHILFIYPFFHSNLM